MELLTRKNGICLMILGIAMFLLNFVTYSLWEIDIDVFGVAIFILGLVIAIACGRTMKKSSGLLSRRNGVWLCIIVFLIIFITNFMPFINGDVAGIISMGLFVLGLIIIAVRWKY